MANYTINNLPNTVTELNSADTLAVWDSANSKTAKINGSNLSKSILSNLVVVDTVTDGNMNPVTSNAVHDALTPVDITSRITYNTTNFTVFARETRVWKIGKLVVVNLKGTLNTTAGYINLANGFPIPVSNNKVINFPFVVYKDNAAGSGDGYISKEGGLDSRWTSSTGEFAANFSYITNE